jgi:mycothiol synthase
MTDLMPMVLPILPDGFIVRAPVADDIQSIVEVMNAHDVLMGGQPNSTEDEIKEEWEDSNFDLTHDAWVVVAPDGKLVGYEVAADFNRNGRIHLDGYVHPDYMNLGIGTFLIHRAEKRALEHIQKYEDGVRLYATAGCFNRDENAHGAFGSLGFRLARHFWHMAITMTEPPHPPVLSDGLTIRTFVIGQDDYATYEAIEESFQDHWDHTPIDYAIWHEQRIESDSFDPSLWFLAIDNTTQQIAGVSLCRVHMDYGWVGGLAVRRPWRKQGLGMALLQHSFQVFYERGFSRVGLSVDAQSLTGATRLYERAGMTIDKHFVIYEKEFRSAGQ